MIYNYIFPLFFKKATIENDSVLRLKEIDFLDPFSFLNNFPLDELKFGEDNSFIYKNYSPNENCQRINKF